MSSERRRRMNVPMVLQQILSESSPAPCDGGSASECDDSMELSSQENPSQVAKASKSRRLSWGEEEDSEAELALPSTSTKECQESDLEDSANGDGAAEDCNSSFVLQLDAAEESDDASDEVMCHEEVLPLTNIESTPQRQVYEVFGRQKLAAAIRPPGSPTTPSNAPAPRRRLPAATPPTPITPASTMFKSVVWKFFRFDKDCSHIAICLICKKGVRRGKPGGHFGTTALISHLKSNHQKQWKAANQKASMSDVQTPAAADMEEGMRQPTLAETFEKKTKFHTSHPVAKMLTALTAAKLALDMEPFSTVENEGFRLLMGYLAPRWEVPSRHYFSRTAVPDLYAEVAAKLGKELSHAEVKKVHLTMDMWTSRQGADFMTVTAHWVTFNRGAANPRQHATLCMQPFDTASHKAADVRDKLQEIIAEWLSSRSLMAGCVTADNASNVIAALKLAKLEHIPCFAHVLNLVVRQFLKQPEIEEMLVCARKICAHFSRSYAARNALVVYQEKHQLPKHQLKTEVATRWNSTLDMLEWLVEQRVAVMQYGMDSHHARSLGGTSLTAAQWQLCKQLCKVLQPFLKATERVSRADASLSEVLPMLCLLQDSLRRIHPEHSNGEESDAEEEELKALVERMLACLWGDPWVKAMADSTTYLSATFLDPRFRDWVPAFQPGENAEQRLAECQASVKAQLQTLLDLDSSSSLAKDLGTGSECAAGCKDTDWWCHCRLSKCGIVSSGTATSSARTGPTANDLLAAYVQDKIQLTTSAEPLLYWNEKKHIWPLLARVAMEALTCQPASVQSERVFSAAGAVVTDKRTRLSAESVQRLTFLKMNGHLMPSRFRAAYADAD